MTDPLVSDTMITCDIGMLMAVEICCWRSSANCVRFTEL